MNVDLTQKRLREVLSYDPRSGEFRWIEAQSNHVGNVAGWIDSVTGYRRIRVDRVMYRANRLAFLYMTGEFSPVGIDHIDGDTQNDRWENLREANQSSNCANSRLPRNNKSGFKGVCWHKRQRKWGASICVRRKIIHLGSFDAPEDAHAAYVAASNKYFGEFARAA